MDLGEPFKHPLHIKPGWDGSFVLVVQTATIDREPAGPLYGFTTIDDLLIWMAKHGTKSRVTELKEGDVVGNGAGLGAAIGMDALSELRRTSAAKTFAERIADAEVIREREDAVRQKFAASQMGQAVRAELQKMADLPHPDKPAA